MPYPTEVDLIAFLVSAGLVTDPPGGGAADADYQTAVDASVDWWESVTGWYPFVADGTDETVRFDPPQGGYLDFASSNGPGGMVSVTSVTTGVSATSSGSVEAEWTDYFLHYHRNRTAVTGIEFRRWPGGGLRSVQVVGDTGFCSDLPHDAFQAILQNAAADLLPQIALALTTTDGHTAGVTEWQEGDIREKFGDNPLSAQAETWRTVASRTAARYRRMRIA